MLATISVHEKITQRVIGAIEQGQIPPWRRPISDLENDGFPTRPSTLKPFMGVDVLLTNMASMARGFRSKFWGSEDQWRYLDCTPTGQATILADGTPVFNADQLLSQGSLAYRSRRRSSPVVVDYSPAEAVIKASGATIHHRMGLEAAYYFPPNDYIVFPFREQFLQLPAYYDSLLHELAHHSD